MIHNVVLCGIGGQGIVLVSTLLRRALGRKFGRVAGYDDRGGAQRLGPVAAVVRFSDDRAYDGPMALEFPDGGAGFVLGLEAGEPLRFDRKLGPRTELILDTCLVPPTNVRRVDGPYFTMEQLDAHYRARGCRLTVSDYRARARALTGNPLDANLFMLGALVRRSGGLLAPGDFQGLADERQLAVLEHGADLEEPRS